MKKLFSHYCFCICYIFFLGVHTVFSQINITQNNFISILSPQYMASGNTTALPIMFSATVTGLTPSTTYRYYVSGVSSTDFGTTYNGTGNPLLVNITAPTYIYTIAPDLTTASNYETFTTDGSGAYTGWFGFVNTSDTRFSAGNLIYPLIVIGNTSGTVLFKWALDVSFTVLAYSISAGATNGTFLQEASSAATQKNMVCIYDNNAGTGRPLYISPIESIGATISSVIAGYSTASGGWNAIIPNDNVNGVRRIEQRSVATGDIVGCAATDADGIWATGSVNTVNPTGGTTATIISSTDALLNPSILLTPSGTNVSCFGGSNGTAVVLATGGTGSYTYSWYSGGGSSSISGLPANTYSVLVTSGACSETTSYTVTEPILLVAALSNKSDDLCQLNVGQVKLTVSGGVSIYTITWSPNHGTAPAPQTISSSGGFLIVAGLHGNTTYDFIVTDDNGCIIQ